MKTTDYLIIGSGIAGLSTAVHLQALGKVTVVTKGNLDLADSVWDQDGVAAVLTKEDRFKKHIEDTLAAGYGRNLRDAVRTVVEHGPRAIRFLESLGLSFGKEPWAEVGHSEKRVWRTSDFTARDIALALVKAVRKSKTIEMVENADAVELIVRNERCEGVWIRQGDATECQSILAKHVILATGGVGGLYEKSDNLRGAAGDGVSLALHAGVEPMDMEFIQFLPTALAKPDGERYFPLSEFLRVFGAKVVDSQGRAFLESVDKHAELGPRDLISRAIHFERLNGPVYLDLRYFNPKEIKANFSEVAKRLKGYGFDVAKDLIPIVPVEHYLCGGVPVNLQGETRLPGLSAVGEVACAGVHGANLLPSNDLLDTLVFAEAVGKAMERRLPLDRDRKLDEAAPLTPPAIVVEDAAQVKAYAHRIATIMTERVGIVRTPQNLRQGWKEINEVPARDYRIQRRQAVCYKIVQACLGRPTSLGCHTMAEDII